MDEIEFMFAYQEAVNAAEKITAPESHTAMMLVLQLINSLNERLVELQGEEAEEDE